MKLARLSALALLTLLISCAACGPGTAPQTVVAPPTVDALFDDIERRTFDYFWKLTDADRGLVLDRYPTPSFSSIAAIGFGLTSYGIGVERGYITRAQARARVLATLRFLSTAPQGPEPTGNAGHRGFFYHFLDVSSGTRYRDSELSTVDTSLMMMGVLFVQSYFDGADPEETEIRTLAENLYEGIDWAWASPRAPGVSYGWRPEQGFLDNDWKGYNEAMFLYVLALGSEAQTVDARAWSVWTSKYDQTWGTLEGQEHLTGGPLFWHQYTAVWIDLRGLRDAYMRGRNLDYFENSRRAVYSQRGYATRNPLGWKGYGPDIWGLTACDGPTDADIVYNGQTRTFHTYAARGVSLDSSHDFDDGTLAPTAVIGSLPFAPEIVIPAIRALRDRYGTEIYGEYGFFDAFNPSFDFDVPLRMGRRVPGSGWIDTDYLGIDQGPILAMIENHRTGFVWSVMKRNAHIRRGLERAGFTGGWLQ